MQRQHRWLPLPVAILLLCVGCSIAWSLPDSTARASAKEISKESLLFVGALNFDCYQDSVFGARVGDNEDFLPRRIIWGRASGDLPEKQGSDQRDSSCLGRTPLRKQLRETLITYPDWDIRGGSVAFQQLNADSLADMVIHIRARVTLKGEQSRNVIRSIAVFGQHGLDSLAVLELGSIDRFQAYPFFAMDLVIGSELNKPGSRDLTGRTSYVLEPVLLDLDDDEKDSTRDMPATGNSISGVQDLHAASMRIYPNPAGNALSIEAARLRAGTYSVRIIGVNGETELQRLMRASDGGDLHAVLDVSQIASGHYAVRIESDNGRLVGIWPVVIIR